MNVVFGDPTTVHEPSTVLGKWASAAVDGSLNVVLCAATLFLLGWCVPATYTMKKKYLRFVAKSRLIRRIESYTPLMFIAMLYLWVREYRRVAAYVAHAAALRKPQARRTSPRLALNNVAAGITPVEDALRNKNALDHVSQELLISTKRKYKAGYGIGYGSAAAVARVMVPLVACVLPLTGC